MKKFIPFLLTIAGAFIMFSCEKEPIITPEPIDPTEETGDPISFGISTGVDTKVDLGADGKKVTWKLSDKLNAVVIKGAAAGVKDLLALASADKIIENGTKGKFQGSTLWGAATVQHTVYMAYVGSTDIRSSITVSGQNVTIPIPSLASQTQASATPTKHIEDNMVKYGSWNGKPVGEISASLTNMNAVLEFRIMRGPGVSAGLEVNSITVENVFAESTKDLSGSNTYLSGGSKPTGLTYTGLALKNKQESGVNVLYADYASATPVNEITLTLTGTKTISGQTDDLFRRFSAGPANDPWFTDAWGNVPATSTTHGKLLEYAGASGTPLIARMLVHKHAFNVGTGATQPATTYQITINTNQGKYVYYKSLRQDQSALIDEGVVFPISIVLESDTYLDAKVAMGDNTNSVNSSLYVPTANNFTDGITRAPNIFYWDRLFYYAGSNDRIISLNGPDTFWLLKLLSSSSPGGGASGSSYKAGATITAIQRRDFNMSATAKPVDAEFAAIKIPKLGRLVYEGQGYMLYDMVMKSKVVNEATGFTSNTESTLFEMESIIRNLHFKRVKVVDAGYVGVLAGTARGLLVEGVVIEEAEVESNERKSASGFACVGGIVGLGVNVRLNACYINGTVTNTYTEGTTTYPAYAGGLIGWADPRQRLTDNTNAAVSNVFQCVSDLTSIDANVSNGRAGGLMGAARGVLAIASYNKAPITGNTIAAGLASYPSQNPSRFYACFSSNTITAGQTKGLFTNIAATALINTDIESEYQSCYYVPSVAAGSGTNWANVVSGGGTFSAAVWPDINDSHTTYGKIWGTGAAAPTVTGGNWWSTVGSAPSNYPQLKVEAFFTAVKARNWSNRFSTTPVTLDDAQYQKFRMKELHGGTDVGFGKYTFANW